MSDVRVDSEGKRSSNARFVLAPAAPHVHICGFDCLRYRFSHRSMVCIATIGDSGPTADKECPQRTEAAPGKVRRTLWDISPRYMVLVEIAESGRGIYLTKEKPPRRKTPAANPNPIEFW